MSSNCILCCESVMKYSRDKAENIFAIGTLSLTGRQVYVISWFHWKDRCWRTSNFSPFLYCYKGNTDISINLFLFSMFLFYCHLMKKHLHFKIFIVFLLIIKFCQQVLVRPVVASWIVRWFDSFICIAQYVAWNEIHNWNKEMELYKHRMSNLSV